MGAIPAMVPGPNNLFEVRQLRGEMQPSSITRVRVCGSEFRNGKKAESMRFHVWKQSHPPALLGECFKTGMSNKHDERQFCLRKSCCVVDFAPKGLQAGWLGNRAPGLEVRFPERRGRADIRKLPPHLCNKFLLMI